MVTALCSAVRKPWFPPAPQRYHTLWKPLKIDQTSTHLDAVVLIVCTLAASARQCGQKGLNLTLVSIVAEVLGLHIKLNQRWSFRDVARQPGKRCGDSMFEVQERNNRTVRISRVYSYTAVLCGGSRTFTTAAAVPRPPTHSIRRPNEHPFQRDNDGALRMAYYTCCRCRMLQIDVPDTACVNP